MDMYEYAIQMEKDAEALYLDLAEKSKVSGIKKVFKMLAEDEVRHRKAIEKLQNNTMAASQKGSAREIATVFEEIKHNFRNLKLDDNVVKDYERALEIEKKGIAHYKKQFEETKDPKIKELYEVLMKHESYHLKTVDNLLDMVRKPEWWVENAEFTPKGDDYY
ncbi:MAG: ferritin family protein [Spirochaetia bacterium]|jgi:rubrerythrin|nr:ferritin family protein [Spirochaetia bacterium]